MEYEDELFVIGAEIIRIQFIVNSNLFPEKIGKITNVYHDGVRMESDGLPFFLSKETYGKFWLHTFDFKHLEFAISGAYWNQKHLELLVEGWGEQLVLAAAKKISPSVFGKVMNICLNR